MGVYCVLEESTNRGNSPMIIVVDLDGTICLPQLEYPDTERRYGLAKPIESVILALRRYKERGDTIIIHTARRMLTHHGDLGKILADVQETTARWLVENNVPYDQLIFGKPYGDLYIDDKCCSPEDFVRKVQDE